jgi:hypothetical protein
VLVPVQNIFTAAILFTAFVIVGAKMQHRRERGVVKRLSLLQDEPNSWSSLLDGIHA